MEQQDTEAQQRTDSYASDDASHCSERTLLLGHDRRRPDGPDDIDDCSGPPSIWVEMRSLMDFAGPIALMNVVRFLFKAAPVIALGRLGTRELAAGNLGILTSNIAGLCIMLVKCLSKNGAADDAQGTAKQAII